MLAMYGIYLYSPTNQTPTILDGLVCFVILNVKTCHPVMGNVHFPTGQHCWDHTEAAGRWRGRSLLLPQILQGTVYLR